MSKPGISILIYSSDAYSDCWDPFFDLFNINFSTQYEFEILLLVNTREYVHKNLNVRVITCGKDTSWSERLHRGLHQAKSDIIFLIGDDFFMMNKMDQNKFDQYVGMIRLEEKIDHIRLLYKRDKFKKKRSDFNDLDQIQRYTKYRFLFAPSLWKRSVLLNYVAESESPFMAEKMGTYRSWIHNHGFYCVSSQYLEKNDRLYDCGSSGVIVKGKWAKWAVDPLQKKELGIDFSKRGIRQEKEKKKAMNQARLQQLMKPVSTIRSYMSVVKLALNEFFFKNS